MSSELMERVFEIVHYEVCDPIPNADTSYLEGKAHSDLLTKKTAEIIALVEADVRDRLLSDGAVDEAASIIADDLPSDTFRIERAIDLAHKAQEASLHHIGIGEEGGDE